MGRRRPTADGGEQTRRRMLDAGLAVLGEDPADRLFERLDARAIAARAGVTSGAFYHHFDGADGFVESLLEYALANEHNPPFAEAVAAFEEVMATGGSFVDGLIAGGNRCLQFQLNNATFSLQMLVWAKSHRDPRLKARLDRMYRLVEEEMSRYFDVMLGLLGREMRPPLDVRDLALAFITMQEGCTLRRGVNLDALPTERLGTWLSAVVESMTRPLDTDGDVTAWLDEHAPKWATG